MSGCIFDGIIRNHVIYDGDNPSNHNLLFLAVTSLSNMSYIRSRNSNQTNREVCSWHKAKPTDIELYKHCIDTKLDSIACFYNDVVYCTDIHCCFPSHKRQINEMYSILINLCILSSAQTIPRGRPADKAIPGWNEQVKSYRERSLFWHWIWLEAGKPMNGYVYNIMKRTRHQYHYAIRCAKRNNTEIIRTKLADNMSNSKDFWKELQKIDPASKSISNTVDQAVRPEQITDKIPY